MSYEVPQSFADTEGISSFWTFPQPAYYHYLDVNKVKLGGKNSLAMTSDSIKKK